MAELLLDSTTELPFLDGMGIFVDREHGHSDAFTGLRNQVEGLPSFVSDPVYPV